MPTILERYQKTFAKDRELVQAANQLFLYFHLATTRKSC